MAGRDRRHSTPARHLSVFASLREKMRPRSQAQGDNRFPARLRNGRERHWLTAWRVSAMLASRPATRTALSVPQARATPIDALAPRLRLPGGFDPADPFVTGQRRDIVPGRQGFRIMVQRVSQISGKIVDAAAGNVSLASHRNAEPCPCENEDVNPRAGASCALSCEAEVRRVMSAMGRWRPAVCCRHGPKADAGGARGRGAGGARQRAAAGAGGTARLAAALLQPGVAVLEGRAAGVGEAGYGGALVKRVRAEAQRQRKVSAKRSFPQDSAPESSDSLGGRRVPAPLRLCAKRMKNAAKG